MKYFFLLISFIFCFMIGKAQVRNSLAEQKLKGQVKYITDKVYIVSDSITNQANKLFSKTISKFNVAGFLIEADNFDKNERLTSYNLYKYDTIRGYKIEDRSYFADSSVKEKFVYKYDEHGNLVEERVYERKDSLKPVLINKYDIKAKEEPEFDTDEEKIEIIITNKHNNLDNYGNWQKEITFEKKVPISVTMREIEYYLKSEIEEK